MSQEAFPRNNDGDIVDDSGYPIIKTAQSTADEYRELAEKKRTHKLQREALDDAKQAKLKASEELVRPEAEVGSKVSAYHRERDELLEDARLLGDSEETAALQAQSYSLAVEEASRDAATHVDENLPAYVQAATEMANAELEPRFGQRAPVVSREEGLIDLVEVTPVDPARSNQDVNRPPSAS
jgi:hypothetical protein